MIRILHCCPSCETEWLGTDPCWVCGQPGVAESLVRYRWSRRHAARRQVL